MSPKATKINFVVSCMLYIKKQQITNIDTKSHFRSFKDTRGQKRRKKLQKVIEDQFGRQVNFVWH